MNDVKNDRAGLRVLDENEIAAVSGGLDPIVAPTDDAERVKTSDKQQKNVMDGAKG